MGSAGSEMGLARGGWGWGWDGFGVGLGTGSLVLPLLTAILNMPTARLMATDIVGLSWGPYYPRYRYAGYPYRRVYYGYAGYPYRRSQRVVACEVETTLKRTPSGGLCCFELK